MKKCYALVQVEKMLLASPGSGAHLEKNMNKMPLKANNNAPFMKINQVIHNDHVIFVLCSPRRAS